MITYSRLGLDGNLGNQMFQIAACFGIAKANNTKAVFPKWKYNSFLANAIPFGELPGAKQIEETAYHYTPFEIAGNSDLRGWFQSAKYWRRDDILELFRFKDEMYKRLSVQPRTLAISVRRGDFVGNENYFQLPATYYLNCYYKNFGSDWNVIIFSDDLAYCRKHFRHTPNVKYANGMNPSEQLCLMSQCHAHIISNSTFSWWGAFLSKSSVVYRPERNFAGKLSINDESDYWLPHWKVFNDYRIDLTNTTFLIPVYYDHEDRLQNVKLTLAFLLSTFDTNVIVMEQGGDSFAWCADYCTYMNFTGEVFHRTRMINEMAKDAKTPVVVNWDCDGIIAPGNIVAAVDAVTKGADIVYPFDGTVVRAPRYFMNDLSQTLDIDSIDKTQCDIKYSSVGHAVVMDRQSFLNAGGENENFISWSCEDSERFNRFRTLGLSVQRVDGEIYHMDHHIGVNSSSANPYFRQGELEFLKIAGMKRGELENYVASWEWNHSTP